MNGGRNWKGRRDGLVRNNRNKGDECNEIIDEGKGKKEEN